MIFKIEFFGCLINIMNQILPIEIFDHISTFASAQTLSRMLTASKQLYAIFTQENTGLIFQYDRYKHVVFICVNNCKLRVRLQHEYFTIDKSHFMTVVSKYPKFLQLLPSVYSVFYNLSTLAFMDRSKYFAMKFTTYKWYRDYIRNKYANKIHLNIIGMPPHQCYYNFIENDSDFIQILKNEFDMYFEFF